RVVVPTNQVLRPAGKQVTFPGRPVDLAFADDGKTIVVKNRQDLLFLDAATGTIRQTLALPKPATGDRPGCGVVGIVVRGDRVYAGDAKDYVRTAERQPDGSYRWIDPMQMEKPAVDVPKPKDPEAKTGAHPAGLAFDGKDRLWATSTRGNNVQLFDLTT